MLADFYRDVLPSQGFYTLFLGPSKRHVWCESLDELIAETESRETAPDTYFAVSSFAEPTRRTGDNALYSRAFYFDIDAGPEKFAKHGDKVYPTRQEAQAAVVSWCKSANLAPSYVLASGAGLHVYFLLDQDTPVDDWLPVATALKAMALGQGLRIDAAVTSDAARILRPLGSLHNNGKNVKALLARPVRYSLESIRGAVQEYVPPPPRVRERSINDDILEAPVGPPKSVEKIGSRCAAMREAMDSAGQVAEPYWRAMLGVIKFTVEGVAAAHKYSKGHPDYDPVATEEKFDRWNAGPTSCLTFEAENPQACAGCEHKGKFKSPIRLGEMTVQETVAKLPPPPAEPEPFADAAADDEPPVPQKDPWDGFLPPLFRVAQRQDSFVMIYRQKVQSKNELGDLVEIEIDTPFTAVPMWFESWAPGSSATDQAMAIYCTYDVQRSRVDRFTFPTKLAAKQDTILSSLAEQNIQVFPSTKNARTAMEDFVKASLERIRATGQRPKVFERFGTSFNAKGQLIVAQGRHIIQPDGTIMEGVVQERLRTRGQAYGIPLPDNSVGAWEATVWDEHIMPRAVRHINYLQEFYGDDNFRPYQLAIMLALSSPMLAFMEGTYRPGLELPGIGLTVSLYSPRSGIGKTSAMNAAALAFGAPSAICLQLDRNNSTDNARQGIVVQSGTLPCFMDEMEDVPAATLANLVSSISNGSVKQRFDKNSNLVPASRIALVNLMSTNKSHRELVSADRTESNAVQMRLLEIECSEVQQVSKERRLQETAARSALHDCAGALGAVIHYEMTKMGHEALSRLGMSCSAKATEYLEGQQDGRFLWRALGAMLAVRRILNNVGLKAFNGPGLVEEFKRWHDQSYEFSREQLMPAEGPHMMALLLSDIAGNTLITDTENRTPGPHATVDVPLNDHIPHNVMARSVLRGNYIYVKTSAIKEWCEKRKVSPVALRNRCRDAGVLEVLKENKVSFQVDLFKGTKLARGVRDSVIKVWTHKLPGEITSAPTPDNVVELRPNEPVKETADVSTANA